MTPALLPSDARPATQTSSADEPCTFSRNGRKGNVPTWICVQLAPSQCEIAPPSPAAQTSSGAAPHSDLVPSSKSGLSGGNVSFHAAPPRRPSVPGSPAPHTSLAPKPQKPLASLATLSPMSIQAVPVH